MRSEERAWARANRRDRQFDGNARTVGAHRLQFDAPPDNGGRPARSEALKPAVVMIAHFHRDNQFGDGPADRVLARIAECRRSRGVKLDDTALCVDNDDTVQSGVDHRRMNRLPRPVRFQQFQPIAFALLFGVGQRARDADDALHDPARRERPELLFDPTRGAVCVVNETAQALRRIGRKILHRCFVKTGRLGAQNVVDELPDDAILCRSERQEKLAIDVAIA